MAKDKIRFREGLHVTLYKGGTGSKNTKPLCPLCNSFACGTGPDKFQCANEECHAEFTAVTEEESTKDYVN